MDKKEALKLLEKQKGALGLAHDQLQKALSKRMEYLSMNDFKFKDCPEIKSISLMQKEISQLMNRVDKKIDQIKKQIGSGEKDARV